jgi:hypothetical protein
MGGKGSTPQAPPPVDPAASMGEYLFGQDFGQFQGITDPALQQRLISAERTFRPQYTALELADIGTMARGIEAGAVNPEYQRLEVELAGLRAGQEVQSQTKAERDAAIEQFAQSAYPDSTQKNKKQFNARQAQLRREYIAAAQAGGEDREARIAQVEAQLGAMDPTLGKTSGLFDLLEESSERAFGLQQEQLQQQREADVGALEEFAPRAVEAYRAADPRSAALADAAQQQALGLFSEASGPLSPERRRMAEQAARSGSLARGRIGDESSIAAELLGREQFKAGLRQEARQAGAGAFGQQRAMAGDLGSTILGRPSAAIGLGGQVLGQAQQGAAGPMGPQLFDPNMGINMALQQRGQDVTFQGMQAQANAAKSAGMMQGLGSALGAFALPCWVAREVYGIENPKWLEFRYWMLNDAPSWFRNLYIKYGEKIAKFISNKPRIKSIIRKWMNTKIK